MIFCVTFQRLSRVKTPVCLPEHRMGVGCHCHLLAWGLHFGVCFMYSQSSSHGILSVKRVVGQKMSVPLFEPGSQVWWQNIYWVAIPHPKNNILIRTRDNRTISFYGPKGLVIWHFYPFPSLCHKVRLQDGIRVSKCQWMSFTFIRKINKRYWSSVGWTVRLLASLSMILRRAFLAKLKQTPIPMFSSKTEHYQWSTLFNFFSKFFSLPLVMLQKNSFV